jgi:HK97 family phage prohead protease
MPYDLEKDFDGCDYAVVKVSPDGTKEIVPGGCHPADELDEAQGHLAALQAAEQEEDRAVNPDGYEPTQAMREEADRGLEWRREFGRGGTLVGVARARDISSGKRLPIDTVRRMHSYFARHEVDKKGQGFSQGEDGYPSAGRIAWALWGGDAGMTWAAAIIAEASDDSERSEGEIMGIEFRKASAELRAVGEDGYTFEGMAALYDSPSGEGTVPEVIKPGAFSRSLAAASRGEWDVRAYADHNPEKLLGTTKTGTLELEDTAEGLRARIRLNPEVSYHRDLAEIVRTMGRSLGMSFGFYSTKANRVNSEGVRELRDVKLVEVSALTGHQPYYPGTLSLVAVRSLADETGVEAEDLRDAVSALLAGEIDEAKASLLLRAMSKTVTISTTVEIEEESGEDHPEEPTEPTQPMPEEVPTEVTDGPEEIEEESARKTECGCESGVPRSVREKQIALARLALR